YIDAAAEVGADAVKFQTHIAHAESTIAEPFRVPFSYEDDTRYAYWRRMEFTADQWRGLADHARDKGLVFLSSPFSVEAVDLLDDIGMAAWKIASGEVGNPLLMERILKTGKPVLLSSGLSGMGDLRAAADEVRRAGCGLAMFQCTSQYPVPLDKVGLNVLGDMAREFVCPVGLSDHSGTPYPALAAMAQGAHMLEIHLTFDPRMFGPDSRSSLDIQAFSEVRRARDAFHTMMSNPMDKEAHAQAQSGMRDIFTRSLALRRDMRAGETVTRADFALKKPGTGLGAGLLEEYTGRRLAHDVPADKLLEDSDFAS
ncbi:MAG: N-acetylneuraminate synthase family protein, partial [Alphaproteobacteria bacterium]|nr:N-acetylneuraminate synthase family protein [Alphaproteobacteria bacterium]